MRVISENEPYNDLRDQPCIVCGEPYARVLGSYMPEKSIRSIDREGIVPVLYYSLCEQCYNNGRIPTAYIEAAFKSKFGKMAA